MERMVMRLMRRKSLLHGGSGGLLAASTANGSVVSGAGGSPFFSTQQQQQEDPILPALKIRDTAAHVQQTQSLLFSDATINLYVALLISANKQIPLF